LTCPWNDPINSVLNSYNYTDVWRQATIPVYQPSARLPLSCFNSDTSVVHIAMDQISYQLGISNIAYTQLSGFLRTSTNLLVNPVQIVKGQVRGLIPNNQDYNITRQFYRNINDTVSFLIPPSTGDKDGYNAYLASVSDSYNKGSNISSSASQQFGDPGTRLAVIKNGLPQDTAIFPTQTVNFNEDAFNNAADDTPANDIFKYFQNALGPVLNVTCPNEILNKMVPGCSKFGCVFSSSATSPCYYNSNTSFSFINNAQNTFFSSLSGPPITGCGVILSECYKTGADFGFKSNCCRGSFTAEMLDSSSFSLNAYPITNSVSFNSPPAQVFSYTARAMYCDSSWVAGAATCDPYLQDYCYDKVSTRDFLNGKGTQTIHSCLDSQHVCGQWYAGIMKEYATNIFTQRNIDIIDNIFVQYCGTGGLAEQVHDSQSCLCINSFFGNGMYYTSQDNPAFAAPVVGASSRSDADILFTDPLCGSIMCITDPQYFTFTDNPNSTISTIVLPSMVSQKRTCPQDICAVVLGEETISINNFSGGTEIDIGNFTNSCYINTGPGTSETRTISANYTYSVQALDDSPPLCGRWPYDKSSLQIIPDQAGGAAGFNLTFNVYGAGATTISNLVYSISGYSSPLFEFNTEYGTWTNIQANSSRELNLSVHPNGIPPPFDGQSSFVDSHQVTLMTSQSGDTKWMQKTFQVSILLFPNGPAPIVPPNNNPSKPLPQLPSSKLSRSSLAMIALSLILLLYALGFFFETMQIRNLITGASELLPDLN